MHVAIIGNGIIGNLAALYLRRSLPESAEISIIGPSMRSLPVVGESTIEITAQFLENQLGLGPYLARNHYPKYGLTYYFKLDPENPTDRTYSVQCNEREPADLSSELEGWDPHRTRPPSWQLNRHVFDRDMQRMVSEHPGIERILGIVTDVSLNGEKGHSLEIREESGLLAATDRDGVQERQEVHHADGDGDTDHVDASVAEHASSPRGAGEDQTVAR